MNEVKQREQQQEGAQETTLARLGELLEQLKSEVGELMESRLTLLAEEVKTEAAAYARGIAVVGLGGAAATVGLALLHTRATRRSGALYLAAGTVAAGLALWRLRSHSLVPARTVAELKKDVELLSAGINQLTE